MRHPLRCNLGYRYTCTPCPHHPRRNISVPENSGNPGNSDNQRQYRCLQNNIFSVLFFSIKYEIINVNIFYRFFFSACLFVCCLLLLLFRSVKIRLKRTLYLSTKIIKICQNCGNFFSKVIENCLKHNNVVFVSPF